MWRQLNVTTPRNGCLAFTLSVLIFFAIAQPLSVSAQSAAQLASADTAIETARQWLTLADAEKISQMWDQSDALMKSKSEQNAWIKYVKDMRIRLGTSPGHRIWQSMEHQINSPSLPQGEFVSVTFVSDYPSAAAWERVSMIWRGERWAPVGYQSGATPADVK